MRLLPVGEAALLVELPAPEDVLPLHAALLADRPAAVVDLVPAHDTVLVTFDPERTRPADVARWVRGTPPAPAADVGGDEVEVPVRYDGEDLAEVGRLTGLGAAGVAAAHAGCRWRVAFTGFAPGFGYLVPDGPPDDGVAALLAVPRRETPRTRVPAGSVALAAGYSGVYPRPSPGGWHLLGSTGATVWDADRDPPALLRPGAVVRFTEGR